MSYCYGLNKLSLQPLYLPAVLYKCRYLSALISQSFLDIGAVSRILDSIMKLCLQFCWNIENHESNPNTSELENISEVRHLFTHSVQTLTPSALFHLFFFLAVLKEFNQKSNSLYTILRSSKLAGSQRAPFLRRFLLRLNFNSFYEVMISSIQQDLWFIELERLYLLCFPVTGNNKGLVERCSATPSSSIVNVRQFWSENLV